MIDPTNEFRCEPDADDNVRYYGTGEIPEDKARCIYAIREAYFSVFHQCMHPRGKGRDGLVCSHHASLEAPSRERNPKSDLDEIIEALEAAQGLCGIVEGEAKRLAKIERALEIARGLKK